MLDVGRPVVVRPTGDLDAATAPLLRQQLRAAVDQGLPVEVDLSAVTFLDAAGAGVLAAARCEAGRAGLRLVVVGAGRAARRVLALCGLQDLVEDGR